jgi:hypothetical protein
MRNHIVLMPKMQKSDMKRILYAGALATSLFLVPTLAQSTDGQGTSSATRTPGAPHGGSPYHVAKETKRARDFYVSVWGIENMLVRLTESNSLIRFSYRVSDPARATPLGDIKATPALIGQRSHALLHIPVMEKVGQLRQTGIPDAGKEYWMVFSNKGGLIKAGDRVNVIIGSFHADGLLVE